MDKTRHEGKTRRNIIVEQFFDAQINEKGREERGFVCLGTSREIVGERERNGKSSRREAKEREREREREKRERIGSCIAKRN